MSSASSDGKNIKEQQPTVITIKKNKLISYNWSLSSMSVHGGSVTTISPDRDSIYRKNKKRNFQKFWSQEIK